MIESQPAALVGLCRRPVIPGDEPFLLVLYASTREEELALVEWAPGMLDAFLRQQFHAQQTHYRSYFPSGEHELVLRGDRPIGRIYLERSDEKLHLLDIALLPDERGRGVGSALMHELIAEAQRRELPVTLHVYSLDTRVLRWYEGLGFEVVGDAGMYHLMERRPQAFRAEA